MHVCAYIWEYISLFAYKYVNADMYVYIYKNIYMSAIYLFKLMFKDWFAHRSIFNCYVVTVIVIIFNIVL